MNLLFNPFLNRESNGYYYVYFFDSKKGKRNKVTTKTKNLEMANRFIEIFLRDKSDLYMDKSNITLEMLRDKIEKYFIKHKSNKTESSYKKVFDNLENQLGNINIKDIVFEDILNFADNLHESGCKNATVNSYMRVLKSIFNKAIKFKYISDNPANSIEKLEEPEKQRAFSEIEVKQLVEFINDKLILRIFLFAVYTGCRLGEILNIQWKDINYNQKNINVLNNKIFKTKNRKIRLIPISDELIVLLKDIQYDVFGEYKNNIIQLHNYLFSASNGKKYNVDYISKKFKIYIRALGLEEHLNFHSTRYTAATFMAINGRKTHEIQKILGHTCISVTERYIKIPSKDLHEAVNTISIPNMILKINKKNIA